MMEQVALYSVYALAFGFPAVLIFRWFYSQWWKANLPAFWAWVLQQRRRDQAIRDARERIVVLEQRLAALEGKVGGTAAEKPNDEHSGIADDLAKAVVRINDVERVFAKFRSRLRSKGIMID